MASNWTRGETTRADNSSQEYDDAEKGLYVDTQSFPPSPALAHTVERRALHVETSMSSLSLFSPVHEGITPFSSVPVLTLTFPGEKPPSSSPPESKPPAKKPARAKPKISRWVLFNLWFNTYKKFFTFVTLLNLAGIIMAALNRFPYAENHLGALVLGNLLCAVLMRNELFLRFLYLIAIYGLRGVCKPLSRFSLFAFRTAATDANENLC